MYYVKNSDLIKLMDDITVLCEKLKKQGIVVNRNLILADILSDVSTTENDFDEKTIDIPHIIYIFNNGTEVTDERIKMREGWSTSILIARVDWRAAGHLWDPVLLEEKRDWSFYLKTGMKGMMIDGDKKL